MKPRMPPVPISAWSWWSYEKMGNSGQSSSMVRSEECLSWRLHQSVFLCHPLKNWPEWQAFFTLVARVRRVLVTWLVTNKAEWLWGREWHFFVSSYCARGLLNTKHTFFSGKFCEKRYCFWSSTKLLLCKFIYSARFKNKMFYTSIDRLKRLLNF